jgi:hypothetical protein
MADPPGTPELPAFLKRARENIERMEVIEPPRGRPMARPRRVNWDQLARDAGVVTRRSSSGGAMTSTGSRQAARALEVLLGSQNIRRAVDLLISGRGSLDARAIAGSVLAYIQSLEATEIAYRVYREASGDEAVQAVGLIKDIAHPRALEWVEEFLADPGVAGVGIGVLDQLIFHHRANAESPEVHGLLAIAAGHPNEHVREQAAFIQGYLREWGARHPDRAQEP